MKLDERDEEAVRRLGRLAREAWSEGPAAPSPEFLIAAIRPALAEIDRERRARPTWVRALDGALARVVSSLRASPALATAAGFAFLLVLALGPRNHLVRGLVSTNLFGPAPTAAEGGDAKSLPALPAHLPAGPSLFRDARFNDARFPSDGLGAVYDISPARRPAVLFHSPDGSVTLWVIDDGDLSYRMDAGGQWG